ncbi:TadA family conjugal transfer-associated ATPase [Corynebacterium lubricantis]|uniref:TadA family conjugal transfer-associated ATPase n=1 Tax=Corynebacterium lubricantis TaxID=541095 RepID=UPI000368CA38|nr:TadA family conjugal transfer-associated ATPase [Corynebacterium lubricantis]
MTSPTLDRDMMERIHQRLADEQVRDEPAKLAALIREEAVVISDLDVLDIMRTLRHDSVGIGQLESLLGIDGVTDICVNGPSAVFIDRGQGLEPAEVSFADEQEIRKLAARLASACGSRLDDAQPFCDGHLTREDGTIIRVHAALAPLAANGTCLSLRILRSATTTLDQLVEKGTAPAELADVLRGLIRNKVSFLVVGGTGTGKTTMLGALLAEVPPAERIIAIEDTVELSPPHPHLVSLTTRGANTEGTGEISMSDLLKQALRMRPDRIVVGEIRGREVVDLLAALNTGHEGGAGTVHANSLAEVPARMEALGALGGLGATALHAQLAAAVKVVIVMKRTSGGKRVVDQVGLLRGTPVIPEVCWESEHGSLHAFAELMELAGRGAK